MDHLQFLWPFLDQRGGQFIATQPNGAMLMSQSFRPWSAKAWGWVVTDSLPTAGSKSFCPDE